MISGPVGPVRPELNIGWPAPEASDVVLQLLGVGPEGHPAGHGWGHGAAVAVVRQEASVAGTFPLPERVPELGEGQGQHGGKGQVRAGVGLGWGVVGWGGGVWGGEGRVHHVGHGGATGR